ncbi:MAG TPA: hypothetical protein VNM47_13825 [Terriglobia bacterium]|nr:hypothetical protein [Terriglobia bacterium]
MTAAVHKAELSSRADQRLGFLLSRPGRVEFRLGLYPEAVTAAKHALAVDRTVRGGQFSQVLFDLPNVAYYSYRAGDSVAAEQAIDPHGEHVARTLVQLAELKMREGEYSDAEHLCERAL